MSPIPAPPADWRCRADRAVARGRLLDRLIPGFLLDSRFSRAGAWYGTTVGWLWGSIWSTGRVERYGRLWVFRGLPAWAFRRGGVCVGRCFLTGDEEPTEHVLTHEAVHARQWERYGVLMPLLYLFAGSNPLRNRFEIEAGLEDGNYVPRGA
ncbi:Fe-S oxidoreductase [Microbacterium terrisoli]|uniref:Fe-S oxidoreductase n=1 Tax=Microbacterium terrisoli TaxID=3242192 RepID=UPI0028063DBB|nr:Fe-S oxidoreductase [Microbacterium protaetiae]